MIRGIPTGPLMMHWQHMNCVAEAGKEFGETEPEAFAARPLQYSAKKQSPITDSQKGYLNDLLKYHRIDTNIRIEDMTKSEASRMIDKIILNYGRMPKSGRRTG